MDRGGETAPAPQAARTSSNGGPGMGAWCVRLQKAIGFKETSATWLWVVLTAIMIGFVFARIVLVFPGGAEAQLAPGEYYHHRTRMARLVIHVISIFLWSILGAIQFIPKVRKIALGYHRWAGRVYLLCAATLAVTGLLMSAHSFGGGATGMAATATISVTFVVSAVMGLVRVRQGFIQEHRAWMLRNYAAGTSVIWSRLTIGLGSLLAKLNDYYVVMECGEILYELDGKMDEILNHFPKCLARASDRVAVNADGPTMVNTIAAMRIGYEIGLWLGLLLNMCAIELWILYCYRMQQAREEKASNFQTLTVEGGEPADTSERAN